MNAMRTHSDATVPTERTASTSRARQALAVKLESYQCWDDLDSTWKRHAILAGSCIYCGRSINALAYHHGIEWHPGYGIA